MKGYEAIAGELHEHGAACVFSVMGEDIAPLLIEFDRLGIRLVMARHESQAVAMADGFSRASGGLGVAAVTSGAGFANCLNTLVTAARASSRVVVIVGQQSPPEDPAAWHPKGLDQLGICAAAEIPAVQPAPGRVLADTRAAVALAREGNTVVLNLLGSLLAADFAEPAATRAETADRVPTGTPTPTSTRYVMLLRGARAPLVPPAPEPESISVVADLLGETWAVSRPVILAGRGAVEAGAGEALRRLGELTGAVLATSMHARSLFLGDPYEIGICGTFASSLVTEFLTRADCILVFGATLNVLQTGGNSLFPQARVVQFDTDPGALGRYTPVEPELAIVADARLAAEALVSELERRGHQAVGYRTAETAARIAAFDIADETPEVTAPGVIDPRTAMRQLDRILPPERIVVHEPSHSFAWTHLLQVAGPDRFFYPLEGNSIGVGLGFGIGVSVARPGAPVVVLIGDGGLMMHLGDIHTAVANKLPLVLVAMNDEGFAMEAHILDLMGLPSDLARFKNPSFAALGEAMGAEGFTVASVDDFAAVEERFREPLDRPVVLDLRIDPAIRAAFVDLLWAAWPKDSAVRVTEDLLT